MDRFTITADTYEELQQNLEELGKQIAADKMEWDHFDPIRLSDGSYMVEVQVWKD